MKPKYHDHKHAGGAVITHKHCETHTTYRIDCADCIEGGSAEWFTNRCTYCCTPVPYQTGPAMCAVCEDEEREARGLDGEDGYTDLATDDEPGHSDW